VIKEAGSSSRRSPCEEGLLPAGLIIAYASHIPFSTKAVFVVRNVWSRWNMVTAIDSEARKLKLAQQKQSKAKLIMDDESVHAGVKKKNSSIVTGRKFRINILAFIVFGEVKRCSLLIKRLKINKVLGRFRRDGWYLEDKRKRRYK
jgi:hypothetical protein